MALQRMDNVGIVVESPDGHGRIELSRFLAPPVVADHRKAPQLVDEVVRYEDVYRLCYVRGPERILIGLAEQLESSRT